MNYPKRGTRLVTYLTAAISFLGIALAGLGLAEFDVETGMIDLAPFNAYALIGALPSVVGLFMAPIALIKGWVD